LSSRLDPGGSPVAGGDSPRIRRAAGTWPGGGWVATKLFHIRSLPGFFNLSTWLTAIAGSAVLLLVCHLVTGADRPPHGTPVNTATRPGPPGQPPAGARCTMGTGTGIFLITVGAV
jgi:hypothetical protein